MDIDSRTKIALVFASNTNDLDACGRSLLKTA